ncbi:MAG: hypothetical protein B6D41_04540 [Chloroflexi bacterium UTCFX4]|jgi:hypothetical protein|nr:MAG: hypothetical protein B6D41_04540 [Chloroflexi bacterium UTCFX4]
MSQNAVSEVIGRAAAEPEFMNLLFNDPGKALAGYELDDAEKAMLHGLTPEDFDSTSGQLDKRVSKLKSEDGEVFPFHS